MKKLFVETKNGKAPIDAELARKYGLEQGAKTPFTDAPIVDEHGGREKRPAAEEDHGAPQDAHDLGDAHDLRGAGDPADRADGTMLTTSEILDFAQGADSGDSGEDGSGESGRKGGRGGSE